MKKATTKDENVTAVIKLTKTEAKKKFLALGKHKSQFPDENGKYYRMPKILFKVLSKYECYSILDEDNKESYNKYKVLQMLR